MISSILDIIIVMIKGVLMCCYRDAIIRFLGLNRVERGCFLGCFCLGEKVVKRSLIWGFLGGFFGGVAWSEWFLV